jgi:hypothetical protein
MQMRSARVRNAKLNKSLRLDMESSRGSLSKELFLFEEKQVRVTSLGESK